MDQSFGGNCPLDYCTNKVFLAPYLLHLVVFVPGIIPMFLLACYKRIFPLSRIAGGCRILHFCLCIINWSSELGPGYALGIYRETNVFSILQVFIWSIYRVRICSQVYWILRAYGSLSSYSFIKHWKNICTQCSPLSPEGIWKPQHYQCIYYVLNAYWSTGTGLDTEGIWRSVMLIHLLSIGRVLNEY